MKLIMKRQPRVGTTQKQKDTKHRRMNKRILELESQNAKLKKVVGAAICPNAMYGCKDGTLYNAYGEDEQCDWCDHVKQALKGENETNNS